MAVIPIAYGDEIFNMSERGFVKLTEKGETIFTPSPLGNVRYQMPGTTNWAEDILGMVISSTTIH